MKRSRGVSFQSCALFSVLMLAAVVMTCAMMTWFLVSGAGLWALATKPSSNQLSVSGDPPEVGAATNRSATDFTLRDLHGNQVSLRQFSGQPVVVNFWATWCPPCRAEVPHLVEAYEREGGEVVFLAISVDEPAGTVRRFAEKNGMPFIILLDDGGKVASNHKVRGIPVTLFISREGEIVARYAGQMSPQRLEEGLSRIR